MNKVYQIVTDSIIAKLEAGFIPWRKPWNGSSAKNAPRNLVTGKQYRGVNTFLLSMQGYVSPFFATFRQIQEKGGHVKKGEQGHMVVFYGSHEVEDRQTGEEKVVPFLRYYKVFNITQCEGIEAPEQDEEEKVFVPIESAELIVDAMPQRPEIRHGQQKAFYSPSLDYVNLPQKETFDSPEDYFNTLFHELGHATGHSSRLARKGVTEASYFGSHEYSKEELVAEMSAAFLSAEAGIETTIHNSAAYIQSWLRALRNDKTMLVSAASQAQKAADFILCQRVEELKAAA